MNSTCKNKEIYNKINIGEKYEKIYTFNNLNFKLVTLIRLFLYKLNHKI